VTAPQPTTDALLMSVRETARRMSISIRKLHAITRAGEIPCVRIGSRVLYSPASIQAWIQKHER
jgi:excisionase family DNA binding protein